MKLVRSLTLKTGIHINIIFILRVISLSMAFNNLIVTSYSKCYIYGDNNWNTPHIFDIKDKDSVSLII